MSFARPLRSLRVLQIDIIDIHFGVPDVYLNCQVTLITGPYSCLAPPLFYAIFGTCVQAHRSKIGRFTFASFASLPLVAAFKASIGTGGLVSLLTGEQLANFGNLEQRTHAGRHLEGAHYYEQKGC